MLKSPPAVSGLALLALGDVAMDRRLPEARIAGVDREFAGIGGYPQVRMREDEVADLAIKRESMRALAYGDHQHRRRTIDRITRGDLPAPGCR